MDNPYVLSYFILITIFFFHGFVRGFTEQATEKAYMKAYGRGRFEGHREGMAKGMEKSVSIYRRLSGDDKTHDLDAITVYRQTLAISSWSRDSDPNFMEHVERIIMDDISRTMLEEGFLNVEKLSDDDKPFQVPSGHNIYVGSVSALKKVPIGQVRLRDRRDLRKYRPETPLRKEDAITEEIIDELKLRGF